MTESQIQSDILRYLEANGHHCFKILSANRAGCPDILGTTSWGRCLAIEVKRDDGVPSLLQHHHLREMRARGALVIMARSVQDVVYHLEKERQS